MRRWTRRGVLSALAVGGVAGGVLYGTGGASPTPDGRWPQQGRTPANTNHDPDPESVLTDTSLAWVAGAYNGVFTAPVVADGTAYVGDYDGGVHALDLENGEPVWRTQVHDGVWTLAVTTDTVFAGSDRLYALDRSDGTRRRNWHAWDWLHLSPRGHVRGPVLTRAGPLVVDVEHEAVMLFDPARGEVAWRTDLAGADQAPAVADGSVYVAAGTDLVALSLGDGSTEWTASVEKGDLVTPTVADGSVFTGNFFGTRAFDSVSGDERWHVTADPGPNGGVAYAGGRVFAGDSHRGVYALDATDGTERWNASLPGSVRRAPAVVAGGEMVYATTKDNVVAGIDGTTGRVAWTYDNGDTIRSPPTPAGGRVVFGDETGSIKALGPPVG